MDGTGRLSPWESWPTVKGEVLNFQGVMELLMVQKSGEKTTWDGHKTRRK